MNSRHPSEDEIFEQARQLSGEARAAYLKDAAGNDKQLRQRIEALLQASENAGDFLNQPAAEFGVPPSGGPPTEPAKAGTPNLTIRLGLPIDEKPGDKIGRYKLREKIGEGGCGVVYVAEQEEPVRRRVALKIIKLGMDTKQVVARFEAERQALALMDHPHIAKVLDAGATDTGRPYFVMELVRGIRITDYCDKNNLPTEERLKLFIQVCSAIQHAHQKGIIHRDIKPSNILVTSHDGVPVPKVIDFGIAKATSDQRLTDKTIYTAFEQFIGTPAYMSPEQAEMSGLDIDTRSDIYSLGVLLYELLTGRTPFDAKELMAAGLDAMRRTIREQEPPKPSTRLTQELVAANEVGRDTPCAPSSAESVSDGGALPRRRYVQLKELIALVRGDLDWIVMKALEKDRTRRFETANALALDVQRHLDNEPIIARPPSRFYQFQKLVQRNKFAFGGVAVVALVLIVGVMVSTWQAIEAQRAKKAEKAERLRAVEARQIAEKGEARYRHLHYVSTMNLARQAWDEDNVTRLKELLKETESNSERGFEWYYWQRQCHLELLTLPVNAQVMSVAVSRDGKLIATGDSDCVVRVWDAITGRELRSFKGHPGTVNPRTERLGTNVWTRSTVNSIKAVAFSPDCQQIVTASMDATARIYEVQSGRELFLLSGHKEGIESVAFSSDGHAIVTGSDDGTARVWDAIAGREMQILDAKTGIRSAQFSPDCKRIATAGWDGTVSVWEASSGRNLLHFKAGDSPVHGIAFSPDGKHIATAGWDNTARIGDSTTGQEQLVIDGHKKAVYAISYSPDGKRLMTLSGDMIQKIWDTSTGRELFVIKGHTGGCRSAAFFSDGQRVVTGSWDGTARVWDVTALSEKAILRGHTGVVHSVTFSPDSQRILTGSEDGTAKIWDVVTRSQMLNLSGHTGSVSSVAFSPDGQRVLTGGKDGTIRLWDATTGHDSLVMRDTNSISDVAFSPDGKRMAAAIRPETIAVWDFPTGRQLLSFAVRPESEYVRNFGHTEEIAHPRLFGLTFSRDGKKIVIGRSHSSCFDRTASVWDVFTGKELLVIETNNLCNTIALSPDGQTIVADSHAMAIQWNFADGTAIKSFKGHAEWVSAAAFTPDGRRIITASDDRTVKVWDADRGGELLTFKTSQSISSLAVSPDGRRIAAAGEGNNVTLWEAASPSQVTVWRKEEKLEE